MEERILDRVINLAKIILKRKGTIRSTAQLFGVSKSTVHKDLTERLRELDIHLFEKVKALLEYNKSVRHIRGGNSTKIKYLDKKNKKGDILI